MSYYVCKHCLARVRSLEDPSDDLLCPICRGTLEESTKYLYYGTGGVHVIHSGTESRGGSDE